MLVGYSIGGALAHALAAKLESSGLTPSGLVLLDTYLPDDEEIVRVFSSVMGQVLDRDLVYSMIGDDDLMALGAYMRLLGESAVGSVKAPSLLVRASEALGGDVRDERWEVADHTVEVTGDRFTIVEEHAEETARRRRYVVVRDGSDDWEGMNATFHTTQHNSRGSVCDNGRSVVPFRRSTNEALACTR